MILSDDTKALIDLVLSYEPDLLNGFYSTNLLQQKWQKDDVVPILEALSDQPGMLRWGDKQHTGFWLLENAKAYKNIEKLEKRERWKERILGFVSGALLTLIAWLLSTLV